MIMLFFCLYRRYDARMDVTESDHKPVRCKFNVDIARVERSIRRQELGILLQSNDDIRSSLEALRFVPETTVNTNRILLQNQDTFNFKITNRSGEDIVFYQIICEGQSTLSEGEVASEYHQRGSLGFPRWLEVSLAFPSKKKKLSVMARKKEVIVRVLEI